MATIISCNAKNKDEATNQYYKLVQYYVKKEEIPPIDLLPDESNLIELLGKTISQFRYDVLIQKYVNHGDIPHIDVLPEETGIIESAVDSIEEFRCDVLVRQFVDKPNRDELTPDEINMSVKANQLGHNLKQRAKTIRRLIDEATMEERQKAREQNPEEYKKLQEDYLQKLENMRKIFHNGSRTGDFDAVKVQEFGENPDQNEIIQGLAKYSDYYPRIIDDYCVLDRIYMKGKVSMTQIANAVRNNKVTLEEFKEAQRRQIAKMEEYDLAYLIK